MGIYDSNTNDSKLNDIFNELFEIRQNEGMMNNSIASTKHPPYDILYGEKEIIVILELNNYEKESISALSNGNTITVNVQRKDKNNYGTEFGNNKETFKISVPIPIKTGLCSHSYNNGVVEVRVKKSSVLEKVPENYIYGSE